MEYPQTILVVDLAVVVEGEEIVLIERGVEPFLGRLALPGGHFEPETDASLAAAALREAREEIGLKVGFDRLAFVRFLDAMDRDPRPGRRVSAVFQVLISREEAEALRAGSDARRIVRRRLAEIDPSEMAFDHGEVIQRLQLAFAPPRP